MAGEIIDSQAELTAYLEQLRTQQTITENWPDDYLYHPVGGGQLVVGIENEQGEVEYNTVWLKRDEAGGAFNSVVLVAEPREFDNLFNSLPDADVANTVEYSNQQAWVNPNTGEVRPANVTEVYFKPGSGEIVSAENSYDSFWSETGEIVPGMRADVLRLQHEGRIDSGEIPEGTPLTQEGKGELMRIKRAFVDSSLIADGVLSASDLETDLRSQGFQLGYPADLVQSEDSQRKAAANEVLFTSFRQAHEALSAARAAGDEAAVTVITDDVVAGSDDIEYYEMAATTPRPDADIPVAEPEPAPALDAAAFAARLQELGSVSQADVDAAKDDKIGQRGVSRALTEIDRLLGGDPSAANAETQNKIIETMQTHPGYADIVADFVQKKTGDPSTVINDHIGMVTGRMLGMTPIVESVGELSPGFGKAASQIESPEAAVSLDNGATPKSLERMGLLPSGDMTEDYESARQALDVIRDSFDSGEADANQLPASQIENLIATYREAGYEGYAAAMEKMVADAPNGLEAAHRAAEMDVQVSYSQEYDALGDMDIQAEIDQGIQKALEHLDVNYDDIRARIPQILEAQGIEGGDNLSAEQTDELMAGVKEAVGTIASEFESFDDARKAEIAETIETRISQAVAVTYNAQVAAMTGQIDSAREDAQANYESQLEAARAAGVEGAVKMIMDLPPEQRDVVCGAANESSSEAMQIACGIKP